jgi:L-iditol 2-dehydrogenase
MSPQKTLAAYLKAPFQVELREVTLPDPGPDEALIRVKACGICGTDLHAARSQATQWQPFGHEIAGIVAKAGSHVKTVKEGDAVALESGSFCGHCELCRDGRVDLCNKAPSFWKGAAMGFSQYMLTPKEALVPFDGLSFEHACLAEPLGVALDMTYTADIALGDDVLVAGLGPIGLMSIPLARMRGAAHVYAANRSAGIRLERARALGADHVFSTETEPIHKHPYRCGGVQRALVSAPPAVLPEVMQIMSYGGVISFIGIEYGPGAQIAFDANEFHFKKLQLRASYASPALYFPTALRLLRDGHVDGSAIITHVLPLERIAGGLELLRDHRDTTLKVVITP